MSVYEVAAATPDPELPMLTIGDLGMLRAVEERDGAVTATLTPTYSGCPAVPEIGSDLRRRLEAAGYGPVTVRLALAPAWSTEWITPEGRRKLAAAGIAPPASTSPGPQPVLFGRPAPVACPHCGSARTDRTAQFGATACRSLYRCADCAEPFEAVKAR